MWGQMHMKVICFLLKHMKKMINQYNLPLYGQIGCQHEHIYVSVKQVIEPKYSVGRTAKNMWLYHAIARIYVK